jgi:hypothetical protein
MARKAKKTVSIKSYKTVDVIRYAFRYLEELKYSFVSGKTAFVEGGNSTAKEVLSDVDTYEARGIDPLSISSQEREDAFRAYVDGLKSTNSIGTDFDFGTSLKILVKSEFVSAKKEAAIVVAGVNSFLRSEKSASKGASFKEEFKGSEYVSHVGNREEFFVRVHAVRYVDRFDCFAWTTVDRDGNVISYFSQYDLETFDKKGKEIEIGDCIVIVGTVKNQNDKFQGVKQTFLNRVKCNKNHGQAVKKVG